MDACHISTKLSRAGLYYQMHHTVYVSSVLVVINMSKDICIQNGCPYELPENQNLCVNFSTHTVTSFAIFKVGTHKSVKIYELIMLWQYCRAKQ